MVLPEEGQDKTRQDGCTNEKILGFRSLGRESLGKERESWKRGKRKMDETKLATQETKVFEGRIGSSRNEPERKRKTQSAPNDQLERYFYLLVLIQIFPLW